MSVAPVTEQRSAPSLWSDAVGVNRESRKIKAIRMERW